MHSESSEVIWPAVLFDRLRSESSLEAQRGQQSACLGQAQARERRAELLQLRREAVHGREAAPDVHANPPHGAAGCRAGVVLSDYSGI